METELSDEQLQEKIVNFIDTKSAEILKLGEKYPVTKSLVINYNELMKYDLDIAKELIKSPSKVIKMFEKAINSKNIPTNFEGNIEDEKFHVRFELPEEFNVKIRDITSDYINKFFMINGIVTKISDILPKVHIATFQCSSCGNKITYLQEKRELIYPSICDSCKKKVVFKLIPEESKFIDLQRLEVQESLEFIRGGEQASKIEVWIEDDLTGKVIPGNTVNVFGTLRLISPQIKQSPIYFKFIEANNIVVIEKEFTEIEISENDERAIKELSKDPKIYEKISSCIGPSIYGYNEIKQAIALQLFGGSKFELPDKTKTRDNIHILLVGDPGVAKSKLLQAAHQLAPKGIYVSGKGVTGAGLTVTAEKDEYAQGSWVLKAGALVLASGGIAFIDEFDKMEKEDRSSMHEAMEQSSISVAKAGIVAKFRSDTSVLAAANPKFGRFDNFKALTDQFDIPSTLLSRFDLIFTIRDVMDMAQDKNVAEHILKAYQKKHAEELKPPIDVELLRKYIAYAKKNLNPQLTDEAKEKIEEFYLSLRKESKETVQTTARQLEALVRLSSASAKLRLSNEIKKEDVERAIYLMRYSLEMVAKDETTGKFDVDRVAYGPKTKRDEARMIMDLIENLTENGKKSVKISDIIQEATKANIPEKDVTRMIDALKREGKLYEPQDGFINLIL